MKVKICGIRRMEDVDYLNETMPDFAGFVFADTRRQVTPEQAWELRQRMDRRIKAFGVFVNAPAETVCRCVRDGSIDAVQLHGDETEEYIRTLRTALDVPVIKAVRTRQAADILAADALPCDYLLLDTYSPSQYGGTGRAFAWDIIPEKLSHPYFLAGGLNEGNIREAIRRVPCFGVDISGGVETDGVKDRQKMKTIINIVRACGNGGVAQNGGE